MQKGKTKKVVKTKKKMPRKITKKDIEKARKEFGPIDARFNLEMEDSSLSVDISGSGKALMLLFSRTFTENETTYEIVKQALAMYEEFLKSPMYEEMMEANKK